jgi:hypothetical protein
MSATDYMGPNNDVNRIADWWADARIAGATVNVQTFKSPKDLLPGDLVIEVDAIANRVYVARLVERQP